MGTLKRESGLWKTVAITLIGIVVTGVSSWLSFGIDSVNRADVARMIERESPYTEDRRIINETYYLKRQRSC